MNKTAPYEDPGWIVLPRKFVSISLSVLSTICIFIHLYKFFRTKTRQSLLTRYLTFYCFFLLLIYMSTLTRITISFTDSENITCLKYLGRIILHLMITATFIKLIIALDLLICFRKVAIYRQMPFLASEDKKFIVYCVLGASIPLFYTLILLPFEKKPNWYEENEVIMKIIRFARLFLILGTFWYILSSGINRQELWSKYSLHMRILVMLGGFSSMITILDIISSIISNDTEEVKPKVDPKDISLVNHEYFWINFFGYLLEGMVIRILITFRKETPHSTTAGISSQQSVPVDSQ